MNQPVDAKIYKGFIDCFSKIVAKEGPRGLWVGFITIWGRFAPTTTCQLVIFSQMKILFDIYLNLRSSSGQGKEKKKQSPTDSSPGRWVTKNMLYQ